MYWAAEFLGAFVAAGVVYGNYINGINQYEGQGIRSVASATNPTGTAGIFATFPASDLTKASQFFDQFIGSALLVFLIWTLKDDSNKGKFVASGAWFPLGLFFVMVSPQQRSSQWTRTNIIIRWASPLPSAGKPASPSTQPVTSAHVS